MAICAVWTLAIPATAHAGTELAGSVGVRAEYDENPFLLRGPNTDSASVTATFAPTLTAQTARGTVKISGSIDFTKYSRLYDTEDSYGIDAALKQQLNPELGLRARSGFSSAVQGQNRQLGSIDPADPPIVLPLPGDDVTLNGLRQRRNTFSGGVGLDWKASASQSYTFDTAAAVTRYPDTGLARDFSYYSGRLGFLQRVNAKLSLGLSGDISQTDYRRALVGDALVYGAQGNFALRIDRAWQVSVGAGISFSRARQIIGSRTRSSGVGTFNLCRKDEISSFCAFASRAVLPTAFGIVRPLTSVGASYTHRLSQRGSLDASTGYSKFSGAGPVGASSGSFRARATYNHRLSERLRGTVSAGYLDSFGDVIQRKASPSISIGLSFDLARPR